MSILKYCIRINLIYELDWTLNILAFFFLQPHHLMRNHCGFFFFAVELMSSCFYSKRDAVHHRSALSLCIPWCHIQPVFASDQP